MEDLPLGRISALVPEFCREGLALGQNSDDYDDDVILVGRPKGKDFREAKT